MIKDTVIKWTPFEPKEFIKQVFEHSDECTDDIEVYLLEENNVIETFTVNYQYCLDDSPLFGAEELIGLLDGSKYKQQPTIAWSHIE